MSDHDKTDIIDFASKRADALKNKEIEDRRKHIEEHITQFPEVVDLVRQIMWEDFEGVDEEITREEVIGRLNELLQISVDDLTSLIYRYTRQSLSSPANTHYTSKQMEVFISILTSLYNTYHKIGVHAISAKSVKNQKGEGMTRVYQFPTKPKSDK